jgi:hypothetical protein
MTGDMKSKANGTLTYTPSPVQTVNGQDVVDYLTSELSKGNLLQDPDAQVR